MLFPLLSSMALADAKHPDARTFAVICIVPAGAGAPPSGGAGPSEESEVARRVRMFWRSLGPNTEAPMYGADTLGTLFAADDDDAWNVGRLVSPRPLPPAVFFTLSSVDVTKKL